MNLAKKGTILAKAVAKNKKGLVIIVKKFSAAAAIGLGITIAAVYSKNSSTDGMKKTGQWVNMVSTDYVDMMEQEELKEQEGEKRD